MPALVRALRASSRPLPSFSTRSSTHARLPAAQAALSTSSRCFVGQESSLHHEDRAKEVEHHKQDQLKKQEEGKTHWKPELASDSEHHIKADKEGHDANPEKIKQMQQETQDTPAEKHNQK